MVNNLPLFRDDPEQGWDPGLSLWRQKSQALSSQAKEQGEFASPVLRVCTRTSSKYFKGIRAAFKLPLPQGGSNSLPLFDSKQVPVFCHT